MSHTWQIGAEETVAKSTWQIGTEETVVKSFGKRSDRVSKRIASIL